MRSADDDFRNASDAPDPPALAGDRRVVVGALAADAAHDLNNLLGGILLAAQYAGSVLGRDDGAAKLRKALADIEHDALLGGEIVGGLLRFACGESVAPAACAIETLVHEAVELARERCPESPAEIAYDFEPSLPDLLARRAELRHALASVIVDALHAGAQHVEVAAAAADGVRLTVRDDGMPHADVPAGAAPKGRSSRRGATLALRLAGAVVRDHSGTMDVASCLTEGACVTLRLPLTSGN
jgi:signal transduction histidine kinase